MKKLYSMVASLFLIYLLQIPVTALAQTAACNQSVTLSSQAQVDNWPVTHGCSLLIGRVTISGNDITNLDSLYSLYEINENLVIKENDVLGNLDGLSTLGFVQNVIIENNPVLANVDGLHSLTNIWDSLKVASNPSLQNLDGLGSITSMQNVVVTDNALIQNVEFLSSFTTIEGVVISSNPSLTSLAGLRNITLFYEVLDITNNESLTNLEGLNKIEKIYTSLRIDANASLTNIDALSKLTNINGGQEAYLYIENNPLLTNLDGLSSLTTVSGSLRSKVIISNNRMLSNVDGLTNLKDIKGGLLSYLTVTNNPNLAMCCGLYQVVYNHSWEVAACEANHVCSTITISGNGPSCTETGIINDCIPDEQKCSGDIRLTTQAAIDSFPTSRGCTTVTGSLLISGAQITNLEGLSALVQAENITITNNYALESLDGLDNLTRVKNFMIDGTYALKDAELPALTTVDEDLVMRVWAVPNLAGFRSLSSVGGDLHITYGGARNMKGFETLTTIGGSLIIDHTGLSNLDGLENLKTIGGKLQLLSNNQLLNVDALLGLDSIGNGGGVSISVTNNLALEWCCGLGRVLQDHLYSGSVNISENSAGCQQSTIEANGPCCQPGSPLPADKFVFAEVPRGYAPLSTNVIVRDYEPGIYYELHNDADDTMVAGPQPGDVGLYASNIMQTTTFNVMARNPATGCRSTMSTKPTVTIFTQPDSTNCAGLPSMDKQVVAENDTVPPGGATNILVLNYDEGVEYVLRNDADNSEVAGPWPGDVGLYSGALNETTVFNVVAINAATGCSQQMSQKVTVAVQGGVMIANVYPNPANGEFTVEVPGETDTYYLSVTDYFGKVVRKEVVQGDGAAAARHLDLRPLQDGIYFLSIYRSKGGVATKKLMIKNN